MAIQATHTQSEPRSVTILGSTGSIGRSTINLLEANLAAYRVEALTARSNVELLARQARQLNARLAVVADESCYGELKAALDGTAVRVAAGVGGLIEAASLPSDWVMAGIVGAAGLQPTLAAVRRGAVVALANKECLVCAGALMLREVARHGATLLPVDSEHNAIFQVFDFDRPERVEKIILTASGGPFREFDRAAMAQVTPSEAVAHPNWDMGAKISVDSATMMNKGLELIEAYHLFPVAEDQIEILVHPQSVVHSMVAYCDGSVLAQLGSPDMRTPIAYSLAWPDRLAAPVPRLDLAQIGSLTFENPDIIKFPAIGLAREVLKMGAAAATTMNAANEVAVHGFLAGRIGFLDIVSVVEETLERSKLGDIASLGEVVEVDGEAREIANALIVSTGSGT
ncbi:MAG: 1-deoxy-D-xylulose-5-phosphate reductoisomerase [Alphaproteobacteria bacterium]